MSNSQAHHQEFSEAEKNLIQDDFRPTRRFYGAFASLSITNLTAAFDATSISVALPIRRF